MIDYDYDRIRTVSEYLTAPSGQLHADLSKLKQESFPNNYRIVFSCFEELDIKVVNDFIIELQKSLTFLDIPNFFVTVISNNLAVKELLVDAAHKHSYEEQSIEFVYADVPKVAFNKPITALLNLPESMCPQPWLSLDVNSQGEFRPCCFYGSSLKNHNNEPFHASRDSFESVYNSKAMRQLREDFKQGKKPADCVRCWKEEADNTTSKRQLLKHRFKPRGYTANWEQDDISNLLFVSVAFGNVCNLKCRICTATNSSQIAAEDIKHSGPGNKKEHKSYKLLSGGDWIKNDTATVWDDLLDPALKFIHLDLSGGEPMLSNRHFEVLQRLVGAGRAKDITIHYNTNGTIFPEKHINLLKQFKHIDIAISIDNLGKQFELERPGVSWAIVEANINSYLSLQEPNIKISIHSVISTQNVYYLPELCSWLQDKQFDGVYLSTLYSPDILNISKVTKEARDVILCKLKSYDNANVNTKLFVNNTIKILESAELSDGQEFCKYMQNLDAIRKVNFADSHPEIAIAMGYERASTN